MLNRTGMRRTGYRGDVYSKRVITWAHCLYLREPASLLKRGEELARRDLPRLLGLAITFQYYDLAFEIVEACRTAGLLPAADQDELGKEIEYLAQHVTKRVFRDAANEVPENVTEPLLSPTMRDKERTDRS